MATWPDPATTLAGYHYLAGTAAATSLIAPLLWRHGDERGATAALLLPMPALVCACLLLGLHLRSDPLAGLPPTLGLPARLALPPFVLATAATFLLALGSRRGAVTKRLRTIAVFAGGAGLVATSIAAPGGLNAAAIGANLLDLLACLTAGFAAVELGALATTPTGGARRDPLERLGLLARSLLLVAIAIAFGRGDAPPSEPALVLGLLGCGFIAPTLLRPRGRSIARDAASALAVLVGALALRLILFEAPVTIG